MKISCAEIFIPLSYIELSNLRSTEQLVSNLKQFHLRWSKVKSFLKYSQIFK